MQLRQSRLEDGAPTFCSNFVRRTEPKDDTLSTAE